MPDPTDSHGRSSNSLHHWRPYLQKTQKAAFKQLEVIVSSQPGAAQGDVQPEENHLQEDQDGDQGTSSGTTVTRAAELRESSPAPTPETAPETAPQSEASPEEQLTSENIPGQARRTQQGPVLGSPEPTHHPSEPHKLRHLAEEGGVRGEGGAGNQNNQGAGQPVMGKQHPLCAKPRNGSPEQTHQPATQQRHLA